MCGGPADLSLLDENRLREVDELFVGRGAIDKSENGEPPGAFERRQRSRVARLDAGRTIMDRGSHRGGHAYRHVEGSREAAVAPDFAVTALAPL